MGVTKRIGLLLQRLGIRDPINDVRFRLTRPSWWVDRQAQLKFLRGCFRKGDLCFDIGASAGDFTESLLELGATAVVAVEPQPASISWFNAKHEQAMQESKVFLVKAGVGATSGIIEMMCPEEGSPIGSMSKQWVDRVRSTNRFDGYEWRSTITVALTTLDALIDQYGVPAFCKIDVEGFEPEVLKGLTKPIRVLSFEYTPENTGHSSACIERLSAIGKYDFNIAIHGRYEYYFSEWLSDLEAIQRFENYAGDPWLSRGGDIYCRLQRV